MKILFSGTIALLITAGCLSTAYAEGCDYSKLLDNLYTSNNSYELQKCEAEILSLEKCLINSKSECTGQEKILLEEWNNLQVLGDLRATASMSIGMERPSLFGQWYVPYSRTAPEYLNQSYPRQ